MVEAVVAAEGAQEQAAATLLAQDQERLVVPQAMATVAAVVV